MFHLLLLSFFPPNDILLFYYPIFEFTIFFHLRLATLSLSLSCSGFVGFAPMEDTTHIYDWCLELLCLIFIYFRKWGSAFLILIFHNFNSCKINLVLCICNSNPVVFKISTILTNINTYIIIFPVRLFANYFVMNISHRWFKIRHLFLTLEVNCISV